MGIAVDIFCGVFRDLVQQLGEGFALLEICSRFSHFYAKMPSFIWYFSKKISSIMDQNLIFFLIE